MSHNRKGAITMVKVVSLFSQLLKQKNREIRCQLLQKPAVPLDPSVTIKHHLPSTHIRAGHVSGVPAPSTGSILILSASIGVICGSILLHPQMAQMNAESQ
jgi:hypothetical protein